jgi:hypothetical protein
MVATALLVRAARAVRVGSANCMVAGRVGLK